MDNYTNQSDMNSLFIKTLVSSIPHPSTHERLKPYEPLIGDWDFDWVGHNQDGTTWKVPGEWFFSWILEGREAYQSEDKGNKWNLIQEVFAKRKTT